MPRDSQRSGRVKLECPHCHQQHLMRIARKGFLRNRIYPIFGLYPWQCVICGKQYLMRKRSAGYWQPARTPGTDRPISPQNGTLPTR
jgi:predicted RNA-binding Zn-ribbon protein involved in translation (DUF1610 family)